MSMYDQDYITSAVDYNYHYSTPINSTIVGNYVFHNMDFNVEMLIKDKLFFLSFQNGHKLYCNNYDLPSNSLSFFPGDDTFLQAVSDCLNDIDNDEYLTETLNDLHSKNINTVKTIHAFKKVIQTVLNILDNMESMASKKVSELDSVYEKQKDSIELDEQGNIDLESIRN